MKYLVIYGEPTRQFFRNAEDAAAGGTANVSKHALLVSVSELNAKVSGAENPENPNMTFTLANEFGEITRLYGIPPLGARAAWMDGDEVTFEGVVKGLTYDPASVVSVQA